MGIWAIVSEGGFVIRHTDGDVHPADCGHADECEGKIVVEIDREPELRFGETVTESGIEFDLSLVHEVIVGDIKARAQEQILMIYPMWRQVMDAEKDPDDPDVLERKRKRDIVRGWSNLLEADLERATDVDAVKAIRLRVSEGASVSV